MTRTDIEGDFAQRVAESESKTPLWINTIEQKIAALEAHISQVGDWAATGGLRREMLGWAESTATRHHLEYKYAESFQRIVLVNEQEHPAEAAAVEAQAEE